MAEYWVQLTGDICGKGSGNPRIATEYRQELHGYLHISGTGEYAICTPLRWCSLSKVYQKGKAYEDLIKLLDERIEQGKLIDDIWVKVRDAIPEEDGHSSMSRLVEFRTGEPLPPKEPRVLTEEEIESIRDYGMF